MASTKASGRNIKESERNTEAVKLRLHYETAETIEERAEEWGLTKSAVVEIAMRLLAEAASGAPELREQLREFVAQEAKGVAPR